MQVNRTYTQRLTLDNPFRAIHNDTLLEILQEKYTQKCFKDCYVTQVVSIIAKGDIRITQNYPPRGNIEVKFKITGVVAPPGYIATGCKIVGIDNGLAMITNEYMCGMIPLNDKNGFLRTDMIVPARVVAAKYNSTKIVAQCVIFRHDEPWPAYQITGAAGDPRDLDWREIYETAKVKAAEITDVRFNVAKMLATPAKTITPGKKIALDEADGVICLNPSLELAAVAAPEHCRVIHCSKNEAIARLLTDYIMYADLIKFIGNTYNNKAATDAHKLYILAVNNSKRDTF